MKSQSTRGRFRTVPVAAGMMLSGMVALGVTATSGAHPAAAASPVLPTAYVANEGTAL